MIWKFPKNGTLFIPKNDLITPWYEQKNSLYDHTMFVWFTPSKIYPHPKMGLSIPTRFVFTSSKFCSHPPRFYPHHKFFVFTHTNFFSHLANLVVFTPPRWWCLLFVLAETNFIHTINFLYSHTPIFFHTLQTWFTPSRPWQLPIQLTLLDATK